MSLSMDGKRILYVTTEMVPYFPETPMSTQSLDIPKAMSSNGADVRIFMPRFGTINERRHQLHEVIRLSGMNLIINDMDQPLIIKVASRSEEHTSELQSRGHLVCRLLLEKKNKKYFTVLVKMLF